MLRFGIICPSAIAFNRFLPALKKISTIKFVGMAYACAEEWFGAKLVDTAKSTVDAVLKSEKEKAEKFCTAFGGEVFSGYEAMLQSGKIDAVYIPLPPALHYKWARKALENGLHVLLEKPSTTLLEDTKSLVALAKEKGLALCENYMFIFHSQIREIQKVVSDGKIGTVRLYRVDFGFPNRGVGDFRYNKALGGGALLDCGGYTLKFANYLLGGDAKITTANSQYSADTDVDIAGSATLCNTRGQAAQVSFGMDNDYRCSIDIWGSEGTLRSGRILTAPDGFEPSYEINKNGKIETFKMNADDSFGKSIRHFEECINNASERLATYDGLVAQASLVDGFAALSGINKGEK